MSPPDDTPPAGRLTRWLDWWFTPRWRALITWVMLAGVSGAGLYPPVHDAMMDVIRWSIGEINSVSPWPLPGGFTYVALRINLVLLLSWFEPFALQLNLSRGAIWLGLRVVFNMPDAFVESPIATKIVTYVLWPAASVLVLRGWRSSPWMSMASTALAVIVWSALEMVPHANWPWPIITATAAIPYAAAMLYCTHLLRPEERARI